MKQLSNIFKVFSAKPLMLLFFFTLLPLMANAQCPDNNHPHMIDLGLPSGTKWACCNVGAQKPEDNGGYYAWGETEEKDNYSFDNYLDGKGTSIGNDIAGTDFDVAHVKWAGSWMMPSFDQAEELRTNCSSEWTTENGVNGRRFTGANGSSIFFPAAGYCRDDIVRSAGSICHYWASTLYESDTYQAYELLFSASRVEWYKIPRVSGLSVRPVIAGSSISSNIDFADPAVKALCVANWDTNGDGELSYDEAAAVTDLGQVFKENEEITSFHELQYFTGLTSIADYAFGYSSLKELVMPQTITCIHHDAFIYCRNLVLADIPSSVTEIEYQAFHGCSSLTSIVIPYGITHIDYNTFTGTGISSITIPESVVTLESSSFACIPNLTSVTIPASVTNISGNPFVGCNALTTILVESGNPIYHADGNCIIETAKNRVVSGCNASVIPSYITILGNTSFCNLNFTEFDVPEGITTLEESVFSNMFYLEKLTLPSTLTSLDDYSIYYCWSLTTITVKMRTPFPVCNIPQYGNQVLETLYVPSGTKAIYETTEGWKSFKNIIEMGITPIDEGQSIDISDEIDENTNLDGNVVGDIYYCISSDSGSYDPEEGCIVVTKPTDDAAIDGKDIFGEDFKAGYAGFMFMVAPGKGTIKVEAQTIGNMVLKVKVDDNAPTQMEVDGKTKVSFSYDVSEPTMVFIYGSIAAAGAKGMRKVSGTDALKIYGIEVTSETNGIEAIDNGQLTIDNSPVYNLNGQRVISSPSGRPGGVPTKGIYIQNGKKVLVK